MPLADAPPAPPAPVVPFAPAFAPTTTALPAMEAQLEVKLQKYVSVPVPSNELVPTLYATVAPGVSDTFVTLEYAPPPPPPAAPEPDPAPPAPPDPIVSILLFDEFQLSGTVHVESAELVKKI